MSSKGTFSRLPGHREMQTLFETGDVSGSYRYRWRLIEAWQNQDLAPSKAWEPGTLCPSHSIVKEALDVLQSKRPSFVKVARYLKKYFHVNESEKELENDKVSSLMMLGRCHRKGRWGSTVRGACSVFCEAERYMSVWITGPGTILLTPRLS